MYDGLNYPTIDTEGPRTFGLYPVDFIMEVFLDNGLIWFKETPEAANLVFGHLKRPILAARYGQEKIDEIVEYINANEIRIIQAFPNGNEQAPTISINLSNGAEMIPHTSLNDFGGAIDALGEDEDVVGRSEIGYSPIQDELLIGIHAVGSPDLAKYLYMLVAYLLNSFREQFEQEGLKNVSFRATDLSRMNEYLPSHLFSRFITVSTESLALFDKGSVPILRDIVLNTNIEGG